MTQGRQSDAMSGCFFHTAWCEEEEKGLPGWLIFVLILLAAFAVFMFYTGYHLFMLASYNAGEARTAKQERAQRRSDVLPEMNPWKDCLEAHEADRAYAAGLAGQDLFIRSGDGLNLHGRYIPAEGEAKRIVLCMPGFRSTPEDDFGEIARWSWETNRK